jgi:hypothetical protein
MRKHKNWLFMLYLASSFACQDERDMIHGLRGLMALPEPSEQATLLNPDYDKSTVEVFRHSVEAALLHFQNTDVLLYLVGDESPSWIPRWDRPMLFRNPFRLGKPLPWKPAGDSHPQWRIDKQCNVLSISAFLVDTIESVCPYNERYFSNATLQTDEGKDELQRTWPKILDLLAESQRPQSAPPVNTALLTAVATALSFGLDADANPADPHHLLYNFVAYLSVVLPADLFAIYVPADVAELAVQTGNGSAFGKPVWDFAYPDAGFFVTSTGLVGRSVCVPQRGEAVIAPLGSTYPLIVRSQPKGEKGKEGEDNELFMLKGYSYVQGAMRGERAEGSDVRVFTIH